MNEAEPFTIEAKGEPLAMIFGSEKGMHVRALVNAVGSMTFRPTTSAEFSPEDGKCHDEEGIVLVEEDWKSSPDEAAATFELKDGDNVLKALSFPGNTEEVDASAELAINREWHEVMQFMGANGIAFGGLHQSFLQASLDLSLEPTPRPRPALPTPIVPGLGHALSA